MLSSSHVLAGDMLLQVPISNLTESTYAAFEELELDVWGFSERDGVEGLDVRVTQNQFLDIPLLSRLNIVEEDLLATHGWEAVKDRVCNGSQEECLEDYYTSYQNLANVHAKIDQLTGRHQVLRPLSIGSSHLNTALKGFEVTNGGSGHQKVFYNCGTHAREWLPVSFCVYLADQLAQRYEANEAQAVRTLNAFDIHIIPVLNPDGYQHSHSGSNMWRKSRKPNRDNSVGTDINRNYCFQWGTGGSSSIPSSDTFMGYTCADNPEVKAVSDYVGSINAIAYMDVHAYGRMWLTPYGYKPTATCRTNPRPCGVDSDADYQHHMACGDASALAIRNTNGQVFSVGPVTYIIYQASGGSGDHMYGSEGVKYPFVPEVRGNSFQPPVSNIGPSNTELYNGVIAQLNYIDANES